MGKFTDKYHLNKSQSLFLAKKGQIKNIYCGMKMENRAVTLDQTRAILNGVNVPNVQLDDIQAILNMRDTWEYLLQTVEEKITFAYWCKLNEYIARNEALEWGKLRTGSVGISGTDYVPPIPEKEQVITTLEDIVSDKGMTATDKALEVFTWGTRGQYFWDGNKRTSLMLANKILISAGAGIMTITDKYMEQFNVLLLEYYNTGKSSELKRFLYDNAIRHTW
ncbi:MAG: Fic family protein [Eubacterium sp.]